MSSAIYNQYPWLQEHFAKQQTVLPSGIDPNQLETRFDGVVLSPDMTYEPEYRPDLMEIYYGDELALCILKGTVVVDRLPADFQQDPILTGLRGGKSIDER